MICIKVKVNIKVNVNVRTFVIFRVFLTKRMKKVSGVFCVSKLVELWYICKFIYLHTRDRANSNEPKVLVALLKRNSKY